MSRDDVIHFTRKWKLKLVPAYVLPCFCWSSKQPAAQQKFCKVIWQNVPTIHLDDTLALRCYVWSSLRGKHVKNRGFCWHDDILQRVTAEYATPKKSITSILFLHAGHYFFFRPKIVEWVYRASVGEQPHATRRRLWARYFFFNIHDGKQE